MTEKICYGCGTKFDLEKEFYLCPNCKMYADEDDPDLKKELQDKGLI